MTPLRLQLRNVLSYAEADLDFTRIHAACLSGRNGHGKSSLIDGITWTLWGEARKGRGSRKPDADILRRGELEMQGILTFRAGGETYRVEREYRESRSGKTTNSNLRFFHLGEGERELTANSQRDTQAAIERTVGASFDVFIATSLFLQGKADEFTKRSPSERKEVLAEVLQLGQYEALRAEAAEEHRGVNRKLEGLEQRRAMLEERAADINKYETRLKEEQEQLKQIQQDVELAREQVEALRERRSALDAKKEQLTLFQKQLTKLLSQHRESTAQLETIQKRQDELAALLARKGEIEEQAQRKELLTKRREQMEDRRSEYEELVSAVRDVEHTLKRTKESIEQEAELTQKLESLPENPEAELKEQKELLATIRENLNETLAERKAVTGRVRQHTTQREKLLETGEGFCETCGQELTEEHRQERIEELTGAIQKLQHEASDLSKAVETRQDTISKVSSRIDQLEAAARRHGLLTHELKQLRARRNGHDPDALDKELQALKARKAEHPFDPETLADLRKELQNLNGISTKLTELRQAEERRRSLNASRKEVEARAGQIMDEVEETKAEIAELEEALQGYDELEANIAGVVTQLKTLRENEQALQSEIGETRARLSSARDAAEKLEELKREKKALEKERAVLDALKVAFGRHGIPSLIIEDVLPNIEERANELLGRLTDGTMEVRFDTLREKKTGGVTDDLDITIITQGAERSYETLSGGESFRVDFAIRLALAQVVGERSGTATQMLVIDEGFGTQDREGLQALVSCIKEVKDDFDLVLVVTHLEELKGAFAQRIDVEKDPIEGSQLTVTR